MNKWKRQGKLTDTIDNNSGGAHPSHAQMEGGDAMSVEITPNQFPHNPGN